jgi:hypothetical protein
LQALSHGITDGHACVDEKCEQYETEGFVSVFESWQILADEANSPSDEQGLAAAEHGTDEAGNDDVEVWSPQTPE